MSACRQQERIGAAECCRAASFQGDIPVLDRRGQLEQVPEYLLRLHSGERGARAEVRAVTGGEVLAGMPVDVQVVGIGEHCRVRLAAPRLSRTWPPFGTAIPPRFVLRLATRDVS